MEIEETNEQVPEAPEEEAAGSEQEPAPAEPSDAETEATPEAVAETEAAAAEPPKAAPKVRRRATKAPAAKPERPKKARAAAKSKARKPIVRLPKPERRRAKAKERRGVVVSNAMDKTIVVRVETVRPHPMYKKVLRRSTKLHAHDPENRANVGDIVRVVEIRPLSKTKAWRLAEIVEAAK